MTLIAIDGPSGSGKSTAARGVAKELGLAYLDTGAMYRVLAVAFLRRGLADTDAESIARLAEEDLLRVTTSPQAPRFYLGDEEVTQEIRNPEVSACVSKIASNPRVRELLTAQMRNIISENSREIVVEGRDITTVVAPNADVRVLLVADPKARMARREAELGGAVNEETLKDQVLRRDRDDSKVSNFTDAAEGVTVIDSTFLSPSEVVAEILSMRQENHS